MKLLKLCRNILIRSLIALALISSLLVPQGFCQETEDSQIFISGFNAYQQKDYPGAIQKMNEVLQKYPDTPLRDMALFWLARSYFKSGNQQEAARYMSQFSREYPDNPLKATVEEELLNLASRYEKGEKLATSAPAAKPSEQQAEARRAKAEQERLARERAEKERVARQLAEQERQATQKAEQERQAAAKAEQERAAAAAAAETARLAAQQAEKEQQARQLAEQERLAVQKAEQERLAAQQEQERLTAQKAEQEPVAAAEAARQVAAQKEQERLAAQKAEQERMASSRAEEERAAAAAAAAETARQAAQQEQERLAAQKAEQERLAAVKAEQERVAAAVAEQAREAARKVEQERAAAAAEVARLAAVQKEQERLAQAKAEEQRRAQEREEQQRLTQLRLEQERAAAEQAEKERLAAAAAESARLAAVKQEQERKAAERAAAEAEVARLAAERQDRERQAAAKAEEQRLAQQRAAEEKKLQEKAALREKAIAQYKSIIERYPSSTAAVTAAAKLKGLGVAVALPPQTAAVAPSPAEQPENAQVLRLEVGQYAGFEFNLLPRSQTFEVGRRSSIPFEVINRGNASDSFGLESAFPAEFGALFAAADAPERSITQTPALAPGESFKGVITLVVPSATIDGLRITHPVKAVSRFMAEASQSREINLTASAPLLRAVLKGDKTQPLPGERVTYRIALLNVGSMAGNNITFRLNFPPQLEPVDLGAAGFRADSKASLVLEGLQINSGESKEYSVSFLVKDDSLAGQELVSRGDLINTQLKTSASFVSNVANVRATHGVLVRAGSERLVIIPGQTFSVPFTVTNTGNVREKLKIVPTISGAQAGTLYHDLNRDGVRQATEPAITELGPLEPKEETSVVMEVTTARTVADGSQGTIQVTFAPEGETARSGTAVAQLLYSRPVLQMAMSGHSGRLKPGEVAAFDLTIINNGSNLARVVELQSRWPEQLELVAADPASSGTSGANIIWKFKELGAGEKRTIKVSFRIKAGTGVGTSIQVANVLKYEDQLGNRY